MSMPCIVFRTYTSQASLACISSCYVAISLQILLRVFIWERRRRASKNVAAHLGDSDGLIAEKSAGASDGHLQIDIQQSDGVTAISGI
ncbi:hypothetical protein DENSPDRAFT_840261 [Dentipellis sp. KUC8613]|nr:hypothetical protein DENSPDRAFT_840261 [Dentipellis sp. KUC8613]